ncbi:hypothetical protein QMO56_24955 [Roseomonas sp. E05]|uniref:hypothetical protein n=1 Tax=Roseomonas sp. E05 TaxID=3046310 RepID=UPI0024BB8AB7|nr:hypothetical protein [Roseomonas sp. E05]MDJ0391361.1 hypothetical protein [Roseomonas sp. E05]
MTISSAPKGRTASPNLATALRGAVVRLHLSPLSFGPSAIVAVAATHKAASPDVLGDRGVLACLLTHDAGVTQPDTRGRVMLAEALAQGGTALLAFATERDAGMAYRWLLALAAARGQA